MASSGGSIGCSRYEAAETAVAVALEDGLRSHDALNHLRALADEIGATDQPTVARGERPHARRALRSIERLLGVSLLGAA